MRKLSQKQLKDIALLCAGAALLLLVAVFIGRGGISSSNLSALLGSGSPQTAATALGDAQGVPYPGYTGQTYPADTTCFINWSYTGYGGSPQPGCPTIGYSYWGNTVGDSDTFSTGIFSVHLGGNTGQSAYQTRTVTRVQPAGPYLGPVHLYCAGVLIPGKGGPSCIGSTKYGAGWVMGCDYPIPAGYTREGASGSNCYAYNAPYFSLGSPSGSAYSGSAPTIGAGQNMTMEWSCLPSRSVYGAVHYSGGSLIGIIYAGNWGATLLYSFGLASSVTGSGSGFAPSGVVGTQTVTAPTTPGTYNYSLTCNGASNAMTISVTVIAYPSLSITGNGTNPTTVVVGQPVTILANFAPSPSGGDALLTTAINDYQNNLWCGSGNTCNATMWTASPLGTKTYTFTPSAAGTYTFYPAEQTTQFPSWNNYGKSLTVTAVASCANGQGAAGSCTLCNSGFVLQGTAPTNSCAAACPANCPGATGAPNCSSTSTYTYNSSNNTCTLNAVCPVNCPGTYPSCVAGNGFAYNSGSNTCSVALPSIGAFSANPTRVRKNFSTPVTFSYTVTNPAGSCTISGPSGFTPVNVSPSNGVPASTVANVTISQTSAFTLTCGSVSVQTSIGLIPVVQEI